MNPEITIAPLPHVAVQVFSETSQVVAVIEEASHDRRMAKAHLRIQAGGAAAAVEAYRDAPTPNVIVIETVSDSRGLLEQLDELAGDEGLWCLQLAPETGGQGLGKVGMAVC